jgi:hypothetical protein
MSCTKARLSAGFKLRREPPSSFPPCANLRSGNHKTAFVVKPAENLAFPHKNAWSQSQQPRPLVALMEGNAGGWSPFSRVCFRTEAGPHPKLDYGLDRLVPRGSALGSSDVIAAEACAVGDRWLGTGALACKTSQGNLIWAVMTVSSRV